MIVFLTIGRFHEINEWQRWQVISASNATVVWTIRPFIESLECLCRHLFSPLKPNSMNSVFTVVQWCMLSHQYFNKMSLDPNVLRSDFDFKIRLHPANMFWVTHNLRGDLSDRLVKQRHWYCDSSSLVLLFPKLNETLLDTLIQKIFVSIMKLDSCLCDWTDISARKEPLQLSPSLRISFFWPFLELLVQVAHETCHLSLISK